MSYVGIELAEERGKLSDEDCKLAEMSEEELDKKACEECRKEGCSSYESLGTNP